MSSLACISRTQLDTALGVRTTDEQWDAISAPLGSAVIVAGAGSGKTMSMAARVAWLAGSGMVRPDAILGLTFTTKATAELLSRMRAYLRALDQAGLLEPVRAELRASDPGSDADADAELGEPQVLTYHSFAARIVAENGIRLGREPAALVMSPSLRSQLAYRLVCRSSLPLAGLGKRPEDITSSLLALDDELTELALSTAELRDFDNAQIAYLDLWDKPQEIARKMRAASSTRLLLADLVDEWHREKAERDVIDFADQIRLARELVEGFPDVATALRERFATVLLDEYQDTSIAQRRILQAVFGHGTPVMAVGDPCQAIYGWRGASVDNIDNFGDHFGVDGRAVDRHRLTQNRRSGPRILEVANRASAHLREVHPGVGALVAGADDKGPGHVACALFPTYRDEAEWVADEIVRTHEGAVPWRHIAVLAATGSDIAEIDSALRRRGVPTQVVGAAALLAQPAVVDLRSWLQVLHDPTANPAFIRIATGPRWRIGPRDLAALGARAAHLAGGRGRSDEASLSAALEAAVAGSDLSETISLTEALDDLGDASRYSAEALERFAALSGLIHRLRQFTGEPLADLIGRIGHAIGLGVEIAQAPADSAALQEQSVEAFLELAAEFADPDGRMGLGAFLSRLADAERLDADISLDLAGAPDAVQLLTIHKSKGLEFGYVFVPFVSAGSFPTGNTRPAWTTSAKTVPWPLRDDCTDELASFPDLGIAPRAKDHDAYRLVLRGLEQLENERLAYVAFTRAERALCVTGHWWGPSQKDPRGPDRFLEQVRQACLDGAGEVHMWAEAPASDDANPMALELAAPVAWPAAPDAAYLARMRRVAERVAQATVPGSVPPTHDNPLVREWDIQLAGLLEEASARRAAVRTVRLPDSLSASLLIRALDNPEQVAADLVRPMPSPPAPAARRGTRLHAWIESRYGQQPLLDPDDLPGAADADIDSDADLDRLKEAFEASPYAERRPVAIEESFSLVIGGRVIAGRIDAVFAVGDEVEAPAATAHYEVVDWKTGTSRGLHPMQLAIYRLAWARARAIPVDQVDAAFVMIGTGEVIRPDTSAELAYLVSGLAP